MFLPNGRKDRTCVIVDVRKTKSAKAADIFIQIKPRQDFEAPWTLRALATGVELDPRQVEHETGMPLAVWQDLMERMKAAKFGVIFFGMGVTMTRGKHANSEALLALTRDMNAYTRFVCKPNRGHGNVTGADNVVTWRTGYPFGVNLGRGYPRFNPGEYTAADVLRPRRSRRGHDHRQRPDGELSANRPASIWQSIPYIAFDPKETPTTRHAAVAFNVPPTASMSPARSIGWTTFPFPCAPLSILPLPSDFEILTALEKRVKQLKAASFGPSTATSSLRPSSPAAG